MPMYIRVTQSVLDPARDQEGLKRLVEEQLIPALRQLPGFRRYTSAVDRAAGRGVAVSDWDSQEHAQAAETALAGLRQELAKLGVQAQPVQVYEVTTRA